MNRRTLLTSIAGAALTVAPACRTVAQEGARQRPRPPDDLPFADHFMALQISDADPHKQRLVLSVASNMQKAYGQDKIAIEVVGFGPGIDVMRESSPYRAIVDSLITQGVRFRYCGNTLDSIERDTGERPKMNSRATEVQAGAERLLTLSEGGYTLIRP